LTNAAIDAVYNATMSTRIQILQRVIDPTGGGLSEELARQLLGLDFPPADHARYEALSSKAGEGTLTDAERAELNDYVDVNDLLTVLRARARASLTKRNPAA
jgi:hypothetical protein